MDTHIYASHTLQKNKEIALASIIQDGNSLHILKNKFKNDKEILGHALYHTSDKIKDDKDVVLIAVTNSGLTLEYASNKLKNDKDVVMAAMNEDIESFEYASFNLQNNKELLEMYLTTLTIQKSGNKPFYLQCQEKLQLLNELEYLEKNIPTNNKNNKTKKF